MITALVVPLADGPYPGTCALFHRLLTGVWLLADPCNAMITMDSSVSSSRGISAEHYVATRIADTCQVIEMTSRPIEHLSEIVAGGTPAYLVDPKTQATFVLLSAEQYNKVRALLNDEHFDISEAYPLMDEVARSEGWDDPELDIYDQLAGQ